MRTDDKTFASLLRNGELFKWSILLLLVTNVILVISVVVIAKRPVQTVAVQPNGQASWTGSANEQVLKNMAIYDTKEFLEGLHTQDAFLGPAARKKALWYLVPNVREQISKQVADSVLLLAMAQSRAHCTIEWDIPPKVISWNYPSVRLFAVFQVVTREESGKVTRQKYNISLDGSFFQSTEARPSGYLIARFNYITDTRDLDQILNKIGG